MDQIRHPLRSSRQVILASDSTRSVLSSPTLTAWRPFNVPLFERKEICYHLTSSQRDCELCMPVSIRICKYEQDLTIVSDVWRLPVGEPDDCCIWDSEQSSPKWPEEGLRKVGQAHCRVWLVVHAVAGWHLHWNTRDPGNSGWWGAVQLHVRQIGLMAFQTLAVTIKCLCSYSPISYPCKVVLLGG